MSKIIYLLTRAWLGLLRLGTRVPGFRDVSTELLIGWALKKMYQPFSADPRGRELDAKLGVAAREATRGARAEKRDARRRKQREHRRLRRSSGKKRNRS
jgi:hypothetical protein